MEDRMRMVDRPRRVIKDEKDSVEDSKDGNVLEPNGDDDVDMRGEEARDLKFKDEPSNRELSENEDGSTSAGTYPFFFHSPC